ncbi:small nuclear ribonucleoprotein [Candidatus Woesearchaeota archaeon]|nr:small nuclear ribonucleoprotein [Candidatus Woesearchaeota archaeon]
MEQARPLDALNKSRDKRILVELKNNKQYIGKLKSFDIHINVVLEDVEEHEIKFKKITKKTDEHTTEETTVSESYLKRKLGNIFIRGDTITVISTE